MARGFLLIDKEAGWTSHDVVAKVRRLTGQKKAGHAGTLDPMATGLVVVGVGKATRLLRFVQELPKEYVARMVFGVATDTLDAEGAILSREPMPVSQGEVEEVLPRFTGTILQVPPMVSALRIDGRRLYELAREGVEVGRPARPVDVYELRLIEFAPGQYPEATILVRCGKGTYVRSLADDLARALGGRAHLTALRRTAIGSLHVDGASSVGELETRWRERIVAPAAALADMPAVTVDAGTAEAVGHGMQFPASVLGGELEDGEAFLVLDQAAQLLAVYRRSGKRAAAEVVLM